MEIERQKVHLIYDEHRIDFLCGMIKKLESCLQIIFDYSIFLFLKL